MHKGYHLNAISMNHLNQKKKIDYKTTTIIKK